MPTINKTGLKCAQLFFKIDTGLLEYECVSCVQRFNTHSECVWHVRSCLRLDEILHSFENSADIGNQESEDVLPPCVKEENVIVELDHPPEEAPQNDNINDDLPDSSLNIKPLDIYKNEYHIQTTTATKTRTPRSKSSANKNSLIQPDKIKLAGAETISRLELNYSRQILRKLRKQHPTLDKLIECDICGYRLKHRSQTLAHMQRKHCTQAETIATVKKYCCEVCGKQMTELGNLIVHKRIHTGERPFPCQFESCERRFLSSSERTIHMRAHRGEKPFKCDQCPKMFHNKNHLNMHLRTLHSNERPFQCEKCGRSFKLREIYKKHMLTHTGERPYHCEICGNSFRQRSAFQVHLNIHTDNRPFKCNHCDRGFHSSAARRSHEKIFHKIP